jgi:hypothetical protein
MEEGAGMDAGRPHGDTRRVTIAEAARPLGVKEQAIMKRIQRDTLDHDIIPPAYNGGAAGPRKRRRRYG